MTYTATERAHRLTFWNWETRCWIYSGDPKIAPEQAAYAARQTVREVGGAREERGWARRMHG